MGELLGDPEVWRIGGMATHRSPTQDSVLLATYAEETQFNYPILVGQEDAMAVAEESGVEFIGLPFTMVVAPSGELIKAHLGEIVESHIEQIVEVLADLDAGSIDIDGAREALGTL